MKAIFPPIFIALIIYFAYLILIGLGFKDFRSIMNWAFDGIHNLVKPKLNKPKPKYIIAGLLGFLLLAIITYLFRSELFLLK